MDGRKDGQAQSNMPLQFFHCWGIINRSDPVIRSLCQRCLRPIKYSIFRRRRKITDVCCVMWWDKNHKMVLTLLESTFLSSSVWVPEVLLLTPVGAVETISKNLMSVQFTSDGIALYDGTNVFYVACSLSIKYNPFDKQSYLLCLTSPRYIKSELMLRSVRNKLFCKRRADSCKHQGIHERY